MSRTISGSSTVGIGLAPWDNPVTVTVTGTVAVVGGYAPHGGAGVDWSITNEGHLSAKGFGIALASGGSAANGSASDGTASIYGYEAGVSIEGSGTIAAAAGRCSAPGRTAKGS